MSECRDLTRWNRAGLSRFRYVDGNSVTFLETLRKVLAGRFPHWKEAGKALPPVEQYRDSRRDLGWEIVRCLCRACHVLTEHIDVYANEGYLGTATQWDNVRCLVEMLDYHPAPPASASIRLTLHVKEGKGGTVRKGFQVKHTPVDGAPVVFETLEDVEVDAGLNDLRIEGHGSSPNAVKGDVLVLEGKVEDLRLGDPLLLQSEDGRTLEGRLIAGVKIGENTTTLRLHRPILEKSGLLKGNTLVHVKPADRLSPLGPVKGGATGEMLGKTLHLKEIPLGLRPGEVVFISDGPRMYYRHVKAVKGRLVEFDRAVGNLSLDGAYVSRPRVVSVLAQGGRSVEGGKQITALKATGDLSSLAKTWVAHIIGSGGELGHFHVFAAPYTPLDPEQPERGGYTILKLVDGVNVLENPQTLLVKPAGRDWEVDSYLEKGTEKLLPKTIITELPKKTSSGDFVVVASGPQIAWGTLANLEVDETEGRAHLTVGRWQVWGGGRFYLKETTVLGHFKKKLRLQGWQDNRTSISGNRLKLEDKVAAEKLLAGRTILIEQEAGDGYAQPHKATIQAIDGPLLTILPPLPYEAGFTVANTMVRANVVNAGHGEAKPEKVLGSGDASRSGQAFVLKVEGVSFVADPSQASGVRADLEVKVDGRIWQQVATFRDSSPADLHYTVRLTEEGYLEITFGDGHHGRRLPSGTNNVRVRYRVGTGLRGNLSAGSLEKPVKPHPLVEGVRQPLLSTGGNDMEGTDSMRENAPATLLTLERGVSLTDFANLAMGHSSIWQARAFTLPLAGRKERIEVVLVRAEGGPLGEVAATLKNFLQGKAIPGIEVRVSDFQRVHLRLSVTVRVKNEEYDPQEVTNQVQARLFEAFSLKSRRISQPVYLSEVYEVVETVAGVENSYCAMKADEPGEGITPPAAVIGKDGAIRVLRTTERQVLYLVSATGLALDHEEFQL